MDARETQTPVEQPAGDEPFRLVLETLPHLAWSARPDGATDYYNRRFLDYLGRGDLPGTPWIESLHPDDRPAAAAAWEQAAATGQDYQGEHRIRRGTDGPYRWHSVRAAPLRDGSGRVVRWLGTCTDIDDRRAAEDARRESERRFRATFADAPVAVMHSSLDGKLQLANRAFCDLLGYSESEMREKTWQDLTHPDDLAADEGLAQQTLAGAIPNYTMEKRYLRKDGSPVWVNLFGNFLRDDAGQVVAGVGVAIDITARRLAEQRLEAVLASIDDHLVCYDHRWRFTYANEGAARMLGKSRGELLGASIWELFPEAVGNQYYRELHEAVETRRVIRSEHYYPPFDQWFENHIYPTADGLTVFSVNITDRKRAERARSESEARFRRAVTASPLPIMIHAEDGQVLSINHAWVEQSGYTLDEIPTIGDWTERAYGERKRIDTRDIDHLYELNRAIPEGETQVRIKGGALRVWELRSAPLGPDDRGRRLVLSIAADVTDRKRTEEALRDAHRRKDDFLAMLAHELRNPLGPIRNAAQILQIIGLSDPVARKSRDMIDRQVSHMARLVDDLLDVSRITQGKVLLRKERCSLSAILRQTAEDYRPTVESNGLTIHVELPVEPLWVDGDQTRLAQVISNLLHNAVKFTDRGGRITVRAACDPAVAGVAVVSVEDTGIGMDAAILPCLFDPFMQADRSLDRARGGLGLGLALVRGMIELHGGQVEARSDGLGRGSTLLFRLPLADRPHAAVLPPPVRQAVNGLRVLLIEDNRDAAESLRLLLSLGGHEVEVAFDGPSGLRLAEKLRPHVILCDVGLPGGMDGYAVARALRAQPELASMRLIALTGYGQEEDLKATRDAGFDLHLVKPAEYAKLLAVLATAR